MCKALSFVICEDVHVIQEISKDGTIVPKPQIIGPLDTISLFSIPSFFSFAIFGSLTDIDISDAKKTMYVVIYSPDGSENFKTDELIIPDLKDFDASLKFSFDIRNYIFKNVGKYIVKLFVDNNIVAETQFIVNTREGSG